MMMMVRVVVVVGGHLLPTNFLTHVMLPLFFW